MMIQSDDVKARRCRAPADRLPLPSESAATPGIVPWSGWRRGRAGTESARGPRRPRGIISRRSSSYHGGLAYRRALLAARTWSGCASHPLTQRHRGLFRVFSEAHPPKQRPVKRNRGWIPAQAACQASDKGPVRVPGRCESRRIFLGVTFALVVQALHDPAGNQFLRPEIVEDQFPVFGEC